jgi:hypothetical protein
MAGARGTGCAGEWWTFSRDGGLANRPKVRRGCRLLTNVDLLRAIDLPENTAGRMFRNVQVQKYAITSVLLLRLADLVRTLDMDCFED